MYFGTSPIQQFVYALKDVTKPSYKVETSQHVLINHTFNFPKNLVWQPITVKMATARNTRNNCDCWLLSQAVDRHTLKEGYLSPDKAQSHQIGKFLMQNIFGDGLDIIQVDEDGYPLEKWTLKNPMTTDVKYGNLSYENEGIVDVDLTIVYDYALWIPVGDAVSAIGDYTEPQSPQLDSGAGSTLTDAQRAAILGNSGQIIT